MEDIVAISAVDKTGQRVAFLTWGRLFDTEDGEELLRAVQAHSSKYDGSPMSRFRLCDSLAEVARHKYFHEALLHFAHQPIPFGEKYGAWRDEKRRALLESGDDLYFLGRLAAVQ